MASSSKALLTLCRFTVPQIEALISAAEHALENPPMDQEYRYVSLRAAHRILNEALLAT